MAGDQELKFPVRCGLRIIFEGEEAPVLAEASMVLATFGMQEELRPGNASSGGKRTRNFFPALTITALPATAMARCMHR